MFLDPATPEFKARLAELKAKYGAIAYHQDAKGEIFVFKKPSRPIWKKFQQLSGRNGADKEACGEQMVVDCFVSPEGAEGKPDYDKLTALFEDLPALPNRIFAELYNIAQGGEENSGKA